MELLLRVWVGMDWRCDADGEGRVPVPRVFDFCDADCVGPCDAVDCGERDDGACWGWCDAPFCLCHAFCVVVLDCVCDFLGCIVCVFVGLECHFEDELECASGVEE